MCGICFDALVEQNSLLGVSRNLTLKTGNQNGTGHPQESAETSDQ